MYNEIKKNPKQGRRNNMNNKQEKIDLRNKFDTLIIKQAGEYYIEDRRKDECFQLFDYLCQLLPLMIENEAINKYYLKQIILLTIEARERQLYNQSNKVNQDLPLDIIEMLDYFIDEIQEF